MMLSLDYSFWQPHTTVVKMALNTHAQTNCNQCLLDASHNHLCIYMTKHNYNWRITLFLVNFWMDVTHCNIGPSMSKFYMLWLVLLAHQSGNTLKESWPQQWKWTPISSKCLNSIEVQAFYYKQFFIINIKGSSFSWPLNLCFFFTHF